MKVYGITNCNTVKKALDWLKGNNQSFDFHDFKKQGVTLEHLQRWSSFVGWEKLLNKKSTTWRALPLSIQQELISEKAALSLMVEKPTLIKRPVIEAGKKLLIGFDEDEYTRTLIK